MAGAGAVAAGTLVAGCSSNANPAPITPTPGPTALTDADYLNFALNLEYLEAEFYLRAATGSGLTVQDTGNAPSKTTGGTQVPGLTMVQSQYMYEIAQNELDHVRFLRSALGSAAVAAPVIDFASSFGALATAAGLPASFTPFDNFGDFLLGAFVFEDVGATAYHGAAPLLTDKGHLTAAAQIHAVEAYHAGSIRTQIVVAGATAISAANKISALRGTLGGGNETALSSTSIVAADKNSIEYARTPDQVLHIVYATGGGAGVKSGGFFPSGLNGNISATQS